MNFEVSEKGTPTDTVECRDESELTHRANVHKYLRRHAKPHLCSEIPVHLLSRQDDLCLKQIHLRLYYCREIKGKPMRRRSLDPI